MKLVGGQGRLIPSCQLTEVQTTLGTIPLAEAGVVAPPSGAVTDGLAAGGGLLAALGGLGALGGAGHDRKAGGGLLGATTEALPKTFVNKHVSKHHGNVQYVKASYGDGRLKSAGKDQDEARQEEKFGTPDVSRNVDECRRFDLNPHQSCANSRK